MKKLFLFFLFLYLGLELDFRGLERVVGREVDHDEEDAAGVRGVGGPHDGCLAE